MFNHIARSMLPLCVFPSVLRVDIPVQMRLCPIFVRDVGSPDIHECFHELTGSQRTPRIWGVTPSGSLMFALIVLVLSKVHSFSHKVLFG